MLLQGWAAARPKDRRANQARFCTSSLATVFTALSGLKLGLAGRRAGEFEKVEEYMYLLREIYPYKIIHWSLIDLLPRTTRTPVCKIIDLFRLKIIILQGQFSIISAFSIENYKRS